MKAGCLTSGRSKQKQQTKDIMRFVWSIRSLLFFFPILFTCIVLFIGLFVWLLSYVQTKVSVNDLSGQLQTEIAARINARSTALLDVPPISVQIVESNYNNGLLNITSFEQVRPILWDYFHSFSQASFITVSSQEENYYAYERNVNGSINLYRSDRETGYTRLAWIVDNSTGLPFDGLGPNQVRANYYPTARGWYVTAVDAGGPDWSSIYFFSTGTLGLTRSSVFKKDDVLQGVVTTDYVLGELNLFMRKIPLPQSGKAFITEDTGLLIASSAGSIDDGARATRLHVTNSSDPTIAICSKALIRKYGSISNMFIALSNTQRLSLQISISGEPYFLEVSRLNYDSKIDWVTVVIVPERALLAKILRATKITMSVSGVVLFLSATVAFIASVFMGILIARPLENVSKQMVKIANMEFDEKEAHDISSLFEFAQMEKALHQMKIGLSNYKKFIPKALLKAFDISNAESSHTISHVRTMTFLYIDIANLSQLIAKEELGSEGVFGLLNKLASYLSDIVEKKKGILDKSRNTGFLALFDSPKKAMKAAESIQESLKSVDVKNLKLSCAICTGTLQVGTIGLGEKIDVTLVSDTLAILSFMMSTAKKYKSSIVFTSDVAEATSTKEQNTRLIGKYLLNRDNAQGKTVLLYEIAPSTLKKDTLQSFNQASKNLMNPKTNAMFADSVALLGALLDIDPSDKLVSAWRRTASKSLEKNMKLQKDLQIQDAITDLSLYTGFHQFCKASFTEESLLLWKSLDDFKSISSSEKRREEATKLFNTYMVTTSTSSVNLSSATIQHISDAIQNDQAEIGPDFFITLQFEMFVLMGETFKRFKETEIYQESFYNSAKIAVSKAMQVDLDSISM